MRPYLMSLSVLWIFFQKSYVSAFISALLRSNNICYRPRPTIPFRPWFPTSGEDGHLLVKRPWDLHRSQQYVRTFQTNIKGKKNNGYKFGDITKGLINKITQKDEYEFGDLSRWIDARVKESVEDFTGKTETGEKYEFGDLTKEFLRRAASSNYDIKDLVIISKTLVTIGAGFSPIAGALPVKVLVEMLNYSILSDVSERLIGALSLELDRRFKEGLTGDPEYRAGDLTRRAIMRFIDKDEQNGDEYAFGDVSRKVFDILEEQRQEQILEKQGSEQTKANDAESIDKRTLMSSKLDSDDVIIDVQSLAARDDDRESKLLSRSQIDPKLLEDLQEWDKKYQANQQQNKD